MQLDTINDLMKKEHGERAFVEHGKPGVLKVSFGGDKMYRYRSNIRDLAERLNLIPEVYVTPEARKVLALLEQGRDSVDGLWVIADTLNWLYQTKNGYTKMVICERTGADEYGRPLAKYFIIETSLAQSLPCNKN